MFAVIEAYESKTDPEDNSSTCLSHVQHRGAADEVLKVSRQLAYDFRVERYGYHLVEFKGECPNCGRSFEY